MQGLNSYSSFYSTGSSFYPTAGASLHSIGAGSRMPDAAYEYSDSLSAATGAGDGAAAEGDDPSLSLALLSDADTGPGLSEVIAGPTPSSAVTLPWVSAAIAPSRPIPPNPTAPDERLAVEWVHGYKYVSQ